MQISRWISRASALCLLAPAMAQEPAAEATSRPTAEQGVLAYPVDKDRVIARVDGRDLTLEDLVTHLDERHAPGFRVLLATPGGNRYFSEQRFGADWVRQFADVVALQAEARARGLDLDTAEPSLSDSLRQAFSESLAHQDVEAEKLPDEVLQARIAKYQQEYGLQTEVQGWLNFLVPDDATERDLRLFFRGHAPYLGGRVTFAHILVSHRDPFTLRLLEGDERKQALEKLADVKHRLAEDGSNFEDVAVRFSDDRKTAARGGVFRYVERFDPRLPAILCQTAWGLADGAWTGPVESAYGWHFVKRISFIQNHHMIVTPQTMPKIADGLRKSQQEDLLFDVREKMGLALRY